MEHGIPEEEMPMMHCEHDWTPLYTTISQIILGVMAKVSKAKQKVINQTT
jgi:hypothetical protein